jgi:GTPase SAR1 family protein
MKRISTVVMESYRLAQYAESLSCYLCGEDNGFDWVRCHYCHAPLSLAQSAKKRREIRLLTAVGSPGCGKTSLLGAMMELLTRPGHEVQLRVCNSLSLSLQESTLISLSQGTFPAATQMEPEHWNWVHCELRKGKKNPVDLVLPDLSAQTILEEWDYPGRHRVVRGSLTRSSGLLLLLDSTRLVAGDRSEEFSAIKTVSYLCELNGHRRLGWPGRPVAIVLTKVDELGRIDRPQQFLSDLAPLFWDLCSERLRQVEVFTTSIVGAVGQRFAGEDAQTVPLRVEPSGVLAPFDWLTASLL